ncbi:MAG: zinc-ribbon domain-containing protein, partial [Solirubrobacteraceae bacterium]
GHDWAATVGNRTNGSGCPRCARSRTRSADARAPRMS